MHHYWYLAPFFQFAGNAILCTKHRAATLASSEGEEKMDEHDIKDVKDVEEENEGEDEDEGIAAAAAQGWEKSTKEQKPVENLKPPFGCIEPGDRIRIQDFVGRQRSIEGNVEFNKEGQEKVSLKGFDYTQNRDGSMVVRDNAGNTFVVAADNTLTVVRAGGQVETYKPTEIMYKDGGSIAYQYPKEAGFNIVRKHRGSGRDTDTGVEITTNSSSFSTTVVPGRAATYSYTPVLQKIQWNTDKKVG